jgi:hypothetical protein
MLPGNLMVGPLIIRLAAKLFPLRTPPEYVGLNLSALKSKYRKRDLSSVVVFLVIAPISIYLWHVWLSAYAQRLTSYIDSVYRLVAGKEFWYVPASILGIVTACVLIHLGNRMLLPDGGREYRYWSNANAGFGVSNMFLSFGIIFTASGLLLAYFAARTHFELTPNELIVQRIWSLKEEHHPYSHISGLKEAIDSKDNSSDFIIEFTDAEPWSTAQEVIFPEAEHKAFLEKVTGKRIQTVSK